VQCALCLPLQSTVALLNSVTCEAFLHCQTLLRWNYVAWWATLAGCNSVPLQSTLALQKHCHTLTLRHSVALWTTVALQSNVAWQRAIALRAGSHYEALLHVKPVLHCEPLLHGKTLLQCRTLSHCKTLSVLQNSFALQKSVALRDYVALARNVANGLLSSQASMPLKIKRVHVQQYTWRRSWFGRLWCHLTYGNHAQRTCLPWMWLTNSRGVALYDWFPEKPTTNQSDKHTNNRNTTE